MDDQDIIVDSLEGGGTDSYDFSWDIMSEDVLTGEIQYLNSQIYNVTKLVREFCGSNNYTPTATEYAKLEDYQIGPGGPIQQYYLANKTYFEPFMRGGTPPGFYDMSSEKQKLFSFSLKSMKDAGQCVKPLDQLFLLMKQLPLYHVFKITQATENLDDSGFDESMYDELDTICEEVNRLLNRDREDMRKQFDRKSERFYQDNSGKISPEELKKGYYKARTEDYLFNYDFYCLKTQKYIKPDENGRFTADLQWVCCWQIVDEYMATVAEALKDDVIGKLENCLTESKKLAAVISSRTDKCETDLFRSTLNAIDGLNIELYALCEYALNVAKNYKNLIEVMPYMFMKKPYHSEQIQAKYGFHRMVGIPLSDGTKYQDMVEPIASALTQHCREYVIEHGRREFRKGY